MNLTIAAVGSTVSIAGHITNIMEVRGIDLKLAAKGPDIANFQQFTGEPLPVKGPFDVAGHLSAPTLENFKISDIAILLGESRISGEIALNQKSPRPQINAKFHSAKLDLRPFIKQDSSGGGEFSSNLDLLTKGNHANLTTKITVKKIDLGEMLKKLGIAQDLEGVIDLDINLAGQGKSVAALMAGLNGDVVAILSEGQMPVK